VEIVLGIFKNEGSEDNGKLKRKVPLGSKAPSRTTRGKTFPVLKGTVPRGTEERKYQQD